MRPLRAEPADERMPMRRQLAAVLLVVVGFSTTAYADPANVFGREELRADAHKQARTTVDDAGIPVGEVSDQPCVDGVAGSTKFTCDGIDLLSFVPQDDFGGSDPAGVGVLGGGVSDIWGWVDPGDEDGNGAGDEYVLAGKTNGVALFRITDPMNPEFLGQIPNSSPGQLVWHDIKIFDDHAFIVSESVAHGMNVFDMTRLRGATEQQTWEPDTNYPTAFSSHNLAINEETGFAYLVGGNTGLVAPDQCLSGLHMVDINDPKNPVFAGCHATGEGRGTGVGLGNAVVDIADDVAGRPLGGAQVEQSPVSYIHDTQCVSYTGPDEDYQGRELCFNSSEDHMSIVDVTNKLLPEQVAKIEYPDTAYAHQGWLTEDMTHFLMGDEIDELDGLTENTRTLVFDVTDIDDASFVGNHDAETTAIDHNLYTKDGLAYQSNYAAGLRVMDTADVANANLDEVAFFDTFPAHDDPEFVGTWSNYPYFPSGTIAVTGIDEGLFLVKVQDAVLDDGAPADGAEPGAAGRAVAEKAKDKGRRG